MYTISKGPSKIVNKTRRGLNQKLDSLESQREYVRKVNDFEQAVEMSSPKPIFHPVNGKKAPTPRVSLELTPHQEDIIKYISEDWNKVYREYELNKQQGAECTGDVTYYDEKEGSQPLENFKPFDLDLWWGQRLYKNITEAT